MFSETLVSRIARLEKQLALVETQLGRGMWRSIDAAYEWSLPQRTIKCIVCETEGRRTDFQTATDFCIFGGGKLERYFCPTCDCVFGPVKYLDLDEAFVSSDYELLYSRYSEADFTVNEIRTFHSLNPTTQGTYLDWGCGGEWSRTVSSLRNDGLDVWGFEPSIGSSVGNIVKNKNELPAEFDGIFSNNVIEHFRDPNAQFVEFKRFLKPGGLMAHSSPCYEYRYPLPDSIHCSCSADHPIFLLSAQDSRSSAYSRMMRMSTSIMFFERYERAS